MSTVPLRLSLSQPYTLRWQGIRYNANGLSADPRPLFVPQFQLIAPGATSFGAWATGAWDADTPASGPCSATVTVGPGQAINPGAAGTFCMAARMFQPAGETPTWSNIRVVILEAP